MGDTTVTVDMALFDRAVLGYVEDLGLSFPKAVRTAARQLDEELLFLTPPKSQAQGRKAVKRDIGRAMMLLDPDKIHSTVLATAVRDQEFDVVRAFLLNCRNKGGQFSTLRLEHFSPSLHQSVRNRRGRVPRPTGVAVLERSEYNNYVREIQGHVGATKSAWGVGAKQLGGNVPDWILKHSQSLGDLEIDDTPHNPSVTTTNRGPGIANLGPGLVQRAVDRRSGTMFRDVEQVLAGRASRYFD